MPADDATPTPAPSPAPARPVAVAQAPVPDRRRRLIVAGVVLVLLVAAAAAFVVVRKQRVARRLAADYERGLVELAQGDYFDALHSVGPYLNINRDDPAANFAYARAREAVEMPRDGHLGEAAGFYRRGIQEAPAHVGADDARVRLARLYARLGGWSELLELTDAVRPESAGDDPRRLELLRLRGIAQLEEGDVRAAAETLDAYAQARPLDADAQLVALSLARRAGDAGAADARLKAVFAAAGGQDDPRLLLVRAGDAQLAGDAAAAADLAARAAESVLQDGLPGEGGEGGGAFDEAAGRWVNRLVALLDSTDQGAVGDELMVRLAGEFRDVDFRRRAANRLFQAGRHDAVLGMTAGESADDGEGELLGLRALSLIETGDRQAALAVAGGMAGREEGSRGRAWSRVIPHWRPGDGPAFGGTRYPDEPDPAARRSDVDAALTTYGHPAFVLMRAENLADLGEGVAAFEQFAGAAQLAGRSGAWPRPVLQAGWQAADAGRGREATQAFIAARRLAPQSATVNAATALLLAREGNPDEALQVLDQLAETAPEAAADPRVRAARVAATPEADVAALADPAVASPLVLRVAEALVRQGRPVGPLLEAAGDRLPPASAAVLRAAADDNVDDVGTEAVAGLTGAGGLAARLAVLRRADPDAARAEAMAVLDPSPSEAGDDLLARRAALESDAIDPSADAGAWRAARQSVAALAEAAGDAGARWAVRLAALDLNRPGGRVDEAQLRESALTLGRVARQYPRFLDARVALIAVLDRLDLADESLEQLRLAAENNPENAAVRLAYADRLIGRADGGGEALQEQLRALADLAVAPRSPVGDAQREAVARLLESQGQDERALAVLGAGGAEADDLRVLRLRRRAGTLDAADVRPLLESGDAASLQFAAETFAAAGLDADADAALDALEAASADDPEAARLAALARAAVDLARGRVEEARGQLDRLVARDPADPVARRLLVSSRLADGDIDAARQAARDAAGAVDADAARTFDAFAQAAADLSALADAARADGGRAADLLRAFPQLARLLPDVLVHGGPAELAAVVASARAAADAPDAEAALKDLAEAAGEAADAAPGSSAAQELAGRLALAAGDQAAALDRARGHARRAQRDPEAARLLVDVLAADGRTAEAAEAAEEWRSRLLRQAGDRATPQTTRPADLTLARLRLAQGQAGQALGHLRPHLTGRDDDPAASTLAAEAHLDLGNGAAALAALGWPDQGPQLGAATWTLWLRASASAASAGSGDADGREVLRRMTDAADGGGPGLLYPLAQAWAGLHAAPVAQAGSARGPADQEAFERVTALLDAALAGREGEASAAEWEQAGVLAGMVGDTPRSVSAYRRALAMDAGRARAANNLAMHLADPPDGSEPTPDAAAEALGLIDRVLALPDTADDPAYAAFLDTRAAALAATGDVAAAVAATERAAEREPRVAEWPLHRAEILAAAGDEAAARRAWRQFARLADPRTADPAIAARAARLADRLGERWR